MATNGTTIQIKLRILYTTIYVHTLKHCVRMVDGVTLAVKGVRVCVCDSSTVITVLITWATEQRVSAIIIVCVCVCCVPSPFTRARCAREKYNHLHSIADTIHTTPCLCINYAHATTMHIHPSAIRSQSQSIHRAHPTHSPTHAASAMNERAHNTLVRCADVQRSTMGSLHTFRSARSGRSRRVHARTIIIPFAVCLCV